jgi:hypothetical protein
MFAEARLSRNGIVAESRITVAFALQIVLAVALLLVSVAVSVSGVALNHEVYSYLIIVDVITVLLLVLAYAKSYAPARIADYEDARVATLILGIVFVLLLVPVVIGVLYLFAYGRLADASYADAQVGFDPIPSPTEPVPRPRLHRKNWIRCANCGEGIDWPGSKCPKCGAALGD